MERTARMIILALLFQLYPRVDEIDDVGSCQQVIDKYAWDSSSHMPRLFFMTHIHKIIQVASRRQKSESSGTYIST